MNILIAPNSMKGSLSAFDFSDTVEQAFLSCSERFATMKLPVADGGDFTGEVLKRALNAETVETQVSGPLGDVTQSKYHVVGKTAILEMADASGMKLVETHRLNPVIASSFGTGQLIAHAVENGCTEIFLAIGGSATVDGGMGMMEALGFRFFDGEGVLLSGNGGNLERIKSIKTPSKKWHVSFKIICDVDNVLLGKQGAAAVFGPQKGASPEMVVQLEKGLENWASIVQNETKKDVKNKQGSGAAGGISVPLLSFFDAAIVPGAEFVLSQLDFEKHLEWADLVITGEGKIDAQTANNKAPYVVARLAKKYGKPVFAFAGVVDKSEHRTFDGVFSIANGIGNTDYAIKNAKSLLFDFSVEFANTIKTLLLHESNQ